MAEYKRGKKGGGVVGGGFKVGGKLKTKRKKVGGGLKGKRGRRVAKGVQSGAMIAATGGIGAYTQPYLVRDVGKGVRAMRLGGGVRQLKIRKMLKGKLEIPQGV